MLITKSNFKIKQDFVQDLEAQAKSSDSSDLDNNTADPHISNKKYKTATGHALIENAINDQFLGKYAYLTILYTKLVRYKTWANCNSYNTKNRHHDSPGLGKLRKVFNLNPHEFVTNITELSKIIGKDKRDVQRELEILQYMGVISIEKPSAQYLLITISNTYTKTVKEADAAVRKDSRSRNVATATFQKSEAENPNVATDTFRNDPNVATDTFRPFPSSIQKKTSLKEEKSLSLEEINIEEFEEKFAGEYPDYIEYSSPAGKAEFLGSKGVDEQLIIRITGLQSDGNAPPLDETKVGRMWHGTSFKIKGRACYDVSEFIKAAKVLGEDLDISQEQVSDFLSFIFGYCENEFFVTPFYSPQCVYAVHKNGRFINNAFAAYKIWKKKNRKLQQGYY